MPRNDNHSIQIAVIKPRDLGRATNVIWEWARFIKRLHEPAIDLNTSIVNYQKLGNDARLKLKDVGSFVGGPFRDGVRQRDNLTARSVLTLDIDDATPKQIRFIKEGKSELQKYEFAGSTTRSHTSEKPKWRLVFPMTRMVTADEYAPLSRIVASKLLVNVTQSMDATDDVSFRVAQVMFWPSQCHDGEFDLIHNEGDLLDPDAVLGAFGDWRDWLQLPYSEKRGQKRPTTVKKAENPLEKPGMIGGFCRAYRVPAAIAKFLPTIYTPGDKRSKKPRYTYVAGSGANGAVVEDDGLFLYSNHGTDPCGERLVNAFDLVRIHLFGDLDNGIADDVAQTKRPSFEAMEKSLADDPLIKAELLKEQYDREAMFEDEPEEDDQAAEPSKSTSVELFDDLLGASKPKTDTSWMATLELEAKGIIKPTLTNVAIIVENDPRIGPSVEFNLFTEEAVIRRPIRSKLKFLPTVVIADPVNGDLWKDRHDNIVRAIIEAPAGKGKPGYGLRVTDRDLKAAVDLVAAKNAFHPVQKYLKSVKWDGVPRMERLFVNYLGAPDSPYTLAIGRLMLLGAVTRVFEPGHKFDFVVILEGLQGKRKSTFISVLARDWFVELEGDLHDRKQLVEKMQGAWILEIPELSGFGKAEIQHIKAVCSAAKDKTRLAWGRRAGDFKRQCIFIGSTNDAEYLRDPTGGRRFWPVVCEVGEIDTDKLRGEIDQIWAETYAAYLAMRIEQPKGTLPLYLSDAEAQAEALVLQESRRIESAEDAYSGVIGDWLDRPVEIPDERDDLGVASKTVKRFETCLMEIWCECLGRPRDQYSEGPARMLGKAMRLLKNWEAVGPRRYESYGNQKSFRRREHNARGLKLRPVKVDHLKDF
jgi:putative DNA primase/helicase